MFKKLSSNWSYGRVIELRVHLEVHHNDAIVDFKYIDANCEIFIAVLANIKKLNHLPRNVVKWSDTF